MNAEDTEQTKEVLPMIIVASTILDMMGTGSAAEVMAVWLAFPECRKELGKFLRKKKIGYSNSTIWYVLCAEHVGLRMAADNLLVTMRRAVEKSDLSYAKFLFERVRKEELDDPCTLARVYEEVFHECDIRNVDAATLEWMMDTVVCRTEYLKQFVRSLLFFGRTDFLDIVYERGRNIVTPDFLLRGGGFASSAVKSGNVRTAKWLRTFTGPRRFDRRFSQSSMIFVAAVVYKKFAMSRWLFETLRPSTLVCREVLILTRGDNHRIRRICQWLEYFIRSTRITE